MIIDLIKKLIPLPRWLKNSWHLFNAVAALIYYRFPSQSLVVIGVTGTDGKTTTATMIYHFLNQAGYKVALISTVAAYIGSEEIDTGFHVTSPSPWSLQKLLRKIVDQQVTYVVLEATSHGLDQHRLLGIGPDIAVMTNITHEHLDYHGSFSAYVAAKAKLFARAKTVVLNKLDPQHKPLKQKAKQSTTTYLYQLSELDKRVQTQIKTKFEQEYNQANATAALTVGQHLGISEDKLISAIESFPGVPGRMEYINNKHQIEAVVDFAHTPNALKEAIIALKSKHKGKIIAVYGSAGLRDRKKRALMGKIGSELADEVVLTAEDPRTESVWTIIDQMMSQVKQNYGHMHKIPDRQEAINFAVSLAKPGDVVACFGKGHEKSMCYGTTEYPWSDAKALKQALSSRN